MPTNISMCVYKNVQDFLFCFNVVSHLWLLLLQSETTNFHFLSKYTDITSKDTCWIGTYQQAVQNFAWDSSAGR